MLGDGGSIGEMTAIDFRDALLAAGATISEKPVAPDPAAAATTEVAEALAPPAPIELEPERAVNVGDGGIEAAIAQAIDATVAESASAERAAPAGSSPAESASAERAAPAGSSRAGRRRGARRQRQERASADAPTPDSVAQALTARGISPAFAAELVIEARARAQDWRRSDEYPG